MLNNLSVSLVHVNSVQVLILLCDIISFPVFTLFS